MLIRNAAVWSNNTFHRDLCVRLHDGLVSECDNSHAAAADEPEIDMDGDYLLPGFVDVHIHGFRGNDTMNGEKAIRAMSRELATIGVAAFCPTTMSASDRESKDTLSAVRRVMNDPEPGGAKILGAHMEAPFLSEAHAGAQAVRFFGDPDWDRFTMIAEEISTVRLITLAPERAGSEAFIQRAAKEGIRVSVGHSDAAAELVHRAGDWGADHITHTFNAQSPLHHRAPGVPGAALTDSRFYCEAICDGIHLHDDTVRLLVGCKGAERMVAITDAMEAAGMPDGEYALGGQKVYVSNGAARLEDGTLAGSVLTMPRVLYRLIHTYGVEPSRACAMCTSTPAESIGEKLAGHMVPGSPAILTRWSPDWQMKSVITSAGERLQSQD